MSDETIFAAALAIENRESRLAYLDRACAGNPELLREVEELLAANAASNVLDHSPVDLARTGAFEPREDGTAPANVGDRIGPYRLMELIGEGGFGLVFVAEQSEPVRRKVALKVIKPGMDTRDVVARFEAERQALALMDHPNIAKVFDAGATAQGRPFFVMELVRGTTITEYCDQQKLAPRDRLLLFVQVCQAVQHAHQKGVIHRDIKPSNVLVAPHDGVPVIKVIDFGVAKAVGQSLTEKTIYTRFAQMIGTPLYMSPEQAEVNQLDVDTRADVYALGVLLYELLTGSTPFDKDRFNRAAFDEIRRIIREEEPPRPSTRLTSLGATLTAVSASRNTDPGKLAGLLRGELDWIVMRCLEKDRNRRYETATGLAKDIQRYITGETVEACPPTLSYRLRKAFRRNRAAVLAVGGVCVALMLIVGATVFAVTEAGKQRELQALFNQADAARADAELARDEATARKIEIDMARENLSRVEYARSIDLAYREFHANNIERADALLQRCEARLRGWEWRYLSRFFHPEESCLAHPSGVESAAFNADASMVATGCRDGIVRLWNTATGKLVRSIPPAERDLGHLPTVQFSPSGSELLAVYWYSARVWNIADGTERLRLDHADTVYSAAFNPDGTRIATSCQDRIVRVWDATSGKQLIAVDRYKNLGRTVRFDKNGDTLAITDGEKSIRLLDASSGKETSANRMYDYPQAARFSPDGTRIAGVESTDYVRVFDRTTGKIWKSLRLNAGRLSDFTWSPDGRRIATADEKHVVRIWDVESEKVVETIFSHAGPVNSVSFSKNGEFLLTASIDRTVRIWNVNRLPLRHILRPMIGVMSLAISPDGKRVALAGKGDVQIWDLQTGQKLWDGKQGSEWISGLAFSPDGKRLASAAEKDGAHLWDAESGKLLATSPPDGKAMRIVAFHPDGRTLVSASENREILILDALTLRVLHQFDHPADPITSAAFTPDGSELVTGTSDSTIRVWDTKTWKQRRTIDCTHERVYSLQSNQDGSRLAVRTKGGRSLCSIFLPEVYCKRSPVHARTGLALPSAPMERGWPPPARMVKCGFGTLPRVPSCSALPPRNNGFT